MRGRGALLAGILAATAAAGCVSDVADAQDPGAATFLLTVRVVSATEPPVAIAGATVSAGDAVGNATAATTDADGVVVLSLAAPQTVSLEIHADAFVATATVPLRVGDETPGRALADVAATIGKALVCGFSLGLACAFDEAVRLPGSAGDVTVRLLPPMLPLEAAILVEPSASTPLTGTTAHGQDFRYADDAELAALHADAVRRIDGAIAWTNAPGAQADLGLLVGCDDRWAESPDDGASARLAPGPRHAAASLDVAEGGCAQPSLWAVVRTAATQVDVQAYLNVTYRPAVQAPIVG